VNFNVYLPDELGEQAKAEQLKLSRLLREAVVNELHRPGLRGRDLRHGS
jgi:post-segregation antitoxin (ccd killing protein)